MREDCISHECEWAFRSQFFAAGAPWIWMSHTFVRLKLLKPVLPNFKINFSRSTLN
jgi:hypothetical protein